MFNNNRNKWWWEIFAWITGMKNNFKRLEHYVTKTIVFKITKLFITLQDGVLQIGVSCICIKVDANIEVIANNLLGQTGSILSNILFKFCSNH